MIFQFYLVFRQLDNTHASIRASPSPNESQTSDARRTELWLLSQKYW